MITCSLCTTEFEPKRVNSKFCSKRCKETAMKRAQRQKHPTTCPDCGVTREVNLTPTQIRTLIGGILCSACNRKRLGARVGPAHSKWRGGHRHWSPGRYGRDKDGLSWKTQRRLAWERAGNRCENPGCTFGELPRRPDVHHKVPYRISQSHALDNLICYCQSCHLIEEAKCQEAWGGQLVTQPVPTQKPCCQSCGSPARPLDEAGVCWTCARQARIQVLTDKAKALKAQKKSLKEIGQLLGVHLATVAYWLGYRAPYRIKRSTTGL